MAWAWDGGGGHLTVPAAILESGSSEEEEEEEEEEEAAPGQLPPLDPAPGDAETRLAQLEEASQALLAELAALDAEVELEQRRWQRAQAFPAQVEQENAQRERLSLARSPGETPEVAPEEVTAVMAPEVAPEEVTAVMAPEVTPEEVTPPEGPPAPAQLAVPWEDLSQLLDQPRNLQLQLQHLHTQLKLEREEQQRLRAALGASQRALSSFKRVSQIVTQDYCQALEQLELEQDLRCHAEAFAHQMLLQQKEAKRQSSILLRSAAPDSQILEALQELGKLSRELEQSRRDVWQREQQLEQQREELDQAREALREAELEKRELRERLEQLEKEAGSLREQLASPPRHPQVPPAPPLPPPASAVPADPLAALRQRKARKPRERSDLGDIRARAVQEMMERIRSGIVLRPARDRGQRQDSMASKRRSAALELQGILGSVRRPSRRQSRDRQLENLLERRRRALEASGGKNSTGKDSTDRNPTGRNSTGKDSMGRNSTGKDSTGRNSMGKDSMGRNSMGKDSMGRNSTGRNSTGKDSLGRNSTGKDSTGKDSTGRNSTADDSTGSDSTGKNSMGNASVGAQEQQGAVSPGRAGGDTGSCHLLSPRPPRPSLCSGNRDGDRDGDQDRDRDGDWDGARAPFPFRPRGLGGLPRARPLPRRLGDSGDTA